MRNFFSIVFIIFFSLLGGGFRSLSSLDLLVKKDKTVGLLLGTENEKRKNQLEELNAAREKLKERASDELQKIAKRLGEIDQRIAQTTDKMKDASGTLEDWLKKIIGVLKERQQVLAGLSDLWKEVDSKIDSHIKLLEEIIDHAKDDEEGIKGKVLYSWKELDEARNKIDQLSTKIKSKIDQKNRSQKIGVDKEAISSLRKEIDTKNSEKKEILSELEELAGKEEGVALSAELRARAGLVEEDIALLQDRIDVSNFKQEDFVREMSYQDDEIFLLQQKSKRLKDELRIIQEKLAIDFSDVEFAKGELESAKKASSGELESIARDRTRAKSRRDGFNNEIKGLDEQLDQLRKAGEVPSVKGYLIESRLMFLKNERLVIERGLDLLETRKDLATANVMLKELKVQIIEVLHTIGVNKSKIGDWLNDFRAKRRSAKQVKKVLAGRNDEIRNFISIINNEIESVREKQKEIEEQAKSLFAGRARELYEVLSNVKDRTIASLNSQKRIVERHLSPLSELLIRQGDVINQLDFVITYLEAQKAEGLWKRSSKAISLKQLMQALFEGEKLFTGLFWDTPSYLGPVSIFYAVKDFDFADYLGIVLFFLFFLLLFVVMKIVLLFVKKNLKHWIGQVKLPASYVFAGGIENFVDFAIEHFSLVFSWAFIFFHVLFRSTYFRPLASSYSVVVFYLATIPILIYLSQRFVLRLRMLNQQLQYLFVSEPLQHKVTILVEIFLYATVTILPLRAAFLEYFEGAVAFAEVSLAAYTLILVIIVLFFFNKEDVLRLLSGRNFIVVWLRKKVDRSYYPVFSFFMFLLILSNPYIGYSNLAWYLAFAVPATLLVLYGIFLLHGFIRKFSLFFFIKEEDDEVINKFEHAKAYYGLFVVVTFIVIALGALIVLARIWGIEGYTLTSLWDSLSNDWVIPIGMKPDEKLGFVELGKLGIFITSGLLISSLVKRFMLGRLFEIFRTEAGVQNTVSRILHYFIIMIALILGFTVIKLSQYALAAGTLLLVGVGFGLRDQIADYFAGILVLLERPLEIGHFVEAGEFQGKVHRISARATTLKTARNFFITIPNRDLISKPIVNWGQGRYAVGCELQIMVSFDSDPDLVRTVLLEVMKQHSMVLRVPSPIVRFEGFEASALYFYCRCYVSARKVLDMWDLASDLRFSVLRAFRDNKIVIPYPQTVVHFSKNCDKKHPDGVTPPAGGTAPPDGSGRPDVSKGEFTQAPVNPLRITFDKD